MTSVKLDNRYRLVLTVSQGRSFPIRPYDFVRVDVRFDGKALRSALVPLKKDPLFKTDMVFRLTGKQLEDHKIRKTPIKIEVFHINIRMRKRYRIGYQILDLRTHVSEVGKPRFIWFDLLGTQTCYAKPQISLAFSAENIQRKQLEFIRAARLKKFVKDRVTNIDPDQLPPQPVPAQDASVPTSQRCGFPQLPHELFCHIFSFLDMESRFRLRRVSQRWSDHLDDPLFYRTLEVDSEALLNPWFRGFIEERGIIPHIQRLVLYSRYEMAKNPPDEPSADASLVPIRRWSDSLAAVLEFFEYFKDHGATIQEICLRNMAIDVDKFSSSDHSPAFKPPCKVVLSNVEFEFKVYTDPLSLNEHVRLFCGDFTVDPAITSTVSCRFLHYRLRIPPSLRDYFSSKIQPLTATEVEMLKNVYRKLVKGRPDCVIRIEALLLLKQLGYYDLPKESLGSYVECLPETLRLIEFDFEILGASDQFRLVYFSQARHFFQLMPSRKCRRSHRAYVHSLIHPEEHEQA